MTKRIGLVGYDCNTGLGEFNRQIAKYIDIDLWLVKPHARMPTRQTEYCDRIICPSGDSKKVRDFVSQVDVVLCCETMFYKSLAQEVKEQGKRLVVVPMVEWLPSKQRSWVPQVDLFICPTQQAHDIVMRDGLLSAYFPWPRDPDRWIYKNRESVKNFLYLNGSGGWHGRKGGECIRQALKLDPELPITIKSLNHDRFPGGKLIKVDPRSPNTELYEPEYDVLLAPHTLDGYGLEPVEAMLNGMPVVTPHGDPWNEFYSIAKLKSTVSRKQVNRPMDWHTCSPENLVQICRNLMDMDIKAESENAYVWAISNVWDAPTIELFEELVRDEVEMEGSGTP